MPRWFFLLWRQHRGAGVAFNCVTQYRSADIERCTAKHGNQTRATMIRTLASLLVATGTGVTLLAAAHSAEPVTIKVGATSTTSDAPIYIADKLGYFSNEGLSVTVSSFRSASDMVAPLGTGELDAGAGSPSAGMYNAVSRGVRIKIVADKASSPPGYGATKILVRKDLVSNTATLNVLLKSAGLKYADVDTVNLPFPDHVAALKNKSVDASASVEPGPAIAIKNGFATLLKSDDQIIPYHQIAVLLFSEKFAEQPDVARRFMRAYLRAVRFYNGALQDGHMAGPNADQVISILAETTSIKDPTIYRDITPTGMNPDGRVNVQSLADDLQFYREQGLIQSDVKLDQIVDQSFVEAAVNELGPYRP
jgi:NitT/TauT family transport system substrate-binding protein